MFEFQDEQNVAVQLPTGVVSHSKSDHLGRKVFDELQLGKGLMNRTFTYHKGEVTQAHLDNDKVVSNPETTLVKQIEFADGRTIQYEYDAEERITKVIDSVDGTYEYTYDVLGQLLTEKKNGTTINTMTYDGYGNIKTKNGVAYTYDTVWKDKLTSYNGKSITYDAQGNPTNYMGITLVWEKGRQLKQFGTNTYTYNNEGIRTSKTVGGVKHTYVLDGTNIVKETWGSNTLIPLYDLDGTVCGINYNGTAYYFYKNLQGDVIAITDSVGATVARYTYDAWGKCTITSDTSDVSIATINPFRYRSYYYDTEIGMYYLQSRYYNPEVGRLISADDSEIVNGNGILLQNLYAYAHNNPVNETDSTGKIIQSLLFKIFAGVFCGFFIQLFNDVLEYLIQCIVKGRNNAKFGSDVGEYLSSILSYTLQFINPFGKSKIISSAISTFVPLAVKYGYKLATKEKIVSYSLITDILLATMKFLAACLLTWGQKNKIAKIKKHGKTKKQVKAQKILIKKSFKASGQRIDLAFEIGEPIINFVLMWVKAFRGD